MGTLLAWIDRISLWSGRLASWLTLAATLILTYEVVARYVFDAPTRWAHDTSTLLFGALYALTGAYALYANNHVGVDLFYSRLSPRARAGLDVATSIFFFAFVGAFFWYGWDFFWDSFRRREFSLNNPSIPIYPAKFAIPLGAGLLLLQGIAKLVRDIHLLVTGQPLEAAARREVSPAASHGAGPVVAAGGATMGTYDASQRGDGT